MFSEHKRIKLEINNQTWKIPKYMETHTLLNKPLITQINVGEDEEPLELSYIPHGNKKDYTATLENSMAVSERWETQTLRV